MKRTVVVIVAALAALTGQVQAGGMQLPTRGVRPTARGGAFVAGADDLGALWFNPAGLAGLARSTETTRRHFLFDLGFVRQRVEYTRVDSGNNDQPMVANDAPPPPIPTVGAAFDLSEDLTVGGGVFAPYLSTGRYPAQGAQRYSLVDLSESLLLVVEIAVGYRVTDRLRIGAGLQNMVTQLVSTLVFSACPGETLCAPEDPQFDAVAKIHQLDAFNPSGVVGVQYEATETVRVGASFQLPFHVNGPASFDTRLPSSALFDGATVVGDKADLRFWLPPILRLGVEVRPTERWRVELAGTVEFWSVHDKFAIEPKNVRIENAPAIGTYELGPLDVPRNYTDSVSVHAGVEGQPVASAPLTVLFGYSYETAAAPDAYLSVMTVDANKQLLSGGLGYRIGNWDLHATVAVVSLDDRNVDSSEGMSPQITPIRDNPDDPDPLRTYVNWGHYESSWFIAGASIQTAF